MNIKVFGNDGSSKGESEFEGLPVFEDAKGLQAVKEVVVAQAAAARQGSACAKTRGDVSGGGKKPWKQKGSGRARSGSNSSPVWVGGGVVFGPKPRDYSKKINKKVKQLAFQRALFDRVSDGSLVVVESLDIAPAKTKVAAELIGKLVQKRGTVLVVDKELAVTDFQAIRNLPNLVWAESAYVNVTDLCKYANIIVTRKGLEALIERAKGASA